MASAQPVNAMLSGLPIPQMNWSARDIDSEYTDFKEMCELIFRGPLGDVTEERKVSYLLLWAGEKGRKLAKTWKLSDDNAKKLDNYWSKFQDYVRPKSNFRIARYKLRTCTQDANETVDSYASRLRSLVNEGKYNNEDEHLIDALIFGVNSQKVQSRLLQEDDKLTFDKAIDIARSVEATREQMSHIRGEKTGDTNIDALRTSKTYKNQRPQGRKNQSQTYKASQCQYCGKNERHGRESCPAKNATCIACGKTGHWKRVCRSKDARVTAKPRSSRQIHTTTKSSDVDENLYFDSIDIHATHHEETQALINLSVTSGSHTNSVTCKLDTGAQGNVMPAKTYRKLMNVNNQNTLSGLKAEFHITETSGPTIIGLPSCRKLGLITLNYKGTLDVQESTNVNANDTKALRPQGDKAARAQVLSDFPDVFQGIGCLEGEYHIESDKSVTPVVHPPRRVPLQKPLKYELDSLVSQGIISKVTQPTDWVNSCVCVTKSNGQIRLCLDPKDLNKAVKRPHYATPTLEDVLSRLNGAKFFTILDARSGYWNIKLDQESALLTTFNTTYGRYCFNRLPMGIKCAQDVFQKKVDETFGDIPGVFGIADDLIVAGFKDDGSDHDATLRTVLERARECGTKFNQEKMVVRCNRIPFYGHIIGENGIEPDPSKVAAINQMQKPTDVKSLQTFLGMVNYLNRFTPRLADLTAPLRDLCKEDIVFIWGPEHDSAFAAIKREIAATRNLPYYDQSKPLTLQVDASTRGLGAALIQDQGPIAFASKALTETESRYSNIEREMLGIVYGLERFHYYVYGRPVIVETDHRPLVSIVQKNLHNAPPRLARMLLRIQRYNVQLCYVPGKDIPLADALSRISPHEEGEMHGMNVSVNEIRSHLNASPARLDEIKEHTARDRELSALSEMISTGWPKSWSDCPALLQPYWTFRDELAVEDGIVMKGLRIVIPNTLKSTLLALIHYAHQGIEKCKLRAKGSVFWIGINKDINQLLSTCGQCQKYQNSQQREPLQPHEIPPRPWHTVSTDLFMWEQNTYLIMVDLFSKFPIVRKLSTTTSKSVINQMRGVFEEHGIIEKLLSDNGPQFTSDEFKRFSVNYGFNHVTSSPHYAQSNGAIERQVQTIKRLFAKCKESGADPHLAMLCLRSTPLDHNTPSPSELLNGRKYRNTLPTRDTISHDGNSTLLRKRQEKSRSVYDRSCKQLPQLRVNDNVRIQDPVKKTWSPGRIVRPSSEPRSYIVQTANGVYRRNRRHVRRTDEDFDVQVNTDCNDAATATTPHTADNSPSTTSVVPPSPASASVRRSTRTIRAPDRLNL